MTATFEELLQQFKDRELTCEDLLTLLSELGYCPNLLNDDGGRWALTSDVYQSVPEKYPSDIESSFYVKKEYWKKSIREAVIFSLKNNS